MPNIGDTWTIDEIRVIAEAKGVDLEACTAQESDHEMLITLTGVDQNTVGMVFRDKDFVNLKVEDIRSFISDKISEAVDKLSSMRVPKVS